MCTLERTPTANEEFLISPEVKTFGIDLVLNPSDSAKYNSSVTTVNCGIGTRSDFQFSCNCTADSPS